MPINDTIASEALAAAAGGAISSGVLYPLEVLKTRMQAEDDSWTIDGDDGGRDDMKNSGIESRSSDNHTEDEDRRETNNSSGDGNQNGISSNIKSAKKKATTTTSIGYARNLYRSEGIGVFFDGMQVSAFQSAIEKACYFFAYTALKRGYSYVTMTRTRHDNNLRQNHNLSAVASVLLGCLAEWVHLPITLPIDALTTAIQTSGGSKKTMAHSRNNSSRNDEKTHTVLALWMTLWKEKSFYKGIQAYWILCFKPALQYTIFEQVKAWILNLRKIRGRNQQQRQQQQKYASQLSAGEAFLLGMFARTVATLVVFPFVRAKVQMQSLARGRSRNHSSFSSASSMDGHYPSTPNIWELLTENYTNGGLKVLYQGLGPELTRGVLSAALMMMVKERISGGIKKILYHDASSSTSSSSSS